MRNGQILCRFKADESIRGSESWPVNVKQEVKVALKIDSELYGSGMLDSFRLPINNTAPQPMEIGNIERKGNYLGKSSRDNSSKHENASERQTDFARNAGFVCHKEGCRASKHRYKIIVGNAKVKNAAFSSCSLNQ